MSQFSEPPADDDLKVGLRTVQAFLAARGYSAMVDLPTRKFTVIFRLERQGQRCTLLAHRETLLGEASDTHLTGLLADRLQEDTLTVLEEGA